MKSNKPFENSKAEKLIALAGNPNVGKSTVFNGLTGQNQHTGNWAGKTVSNAIGYCKSTNNSYVFADIPGTYSLFAHSAEEEVARRFICFSSPYRTVVVCDACCLERNLNFVLQLMEVNGNVVVCVNLMDEAKRKHIKIDLQSLSKTLGVPVVGVTARKKQSLKALLSVLDKEEKCREALVIEYSDIVEKAVSMTISAIESYPHPNISARFLALRLLDGDTSLVGEINEYCGCELSELPEVKAAKQMLFDAGMGENELKDEVVTSLVKKAEEIAQSTVIYEKSGYDKTDRRLDRILTNRATGYPVMLMLLLFVFWLTIVGANYPSQMLSEGLFWIQERLTDLFTFLNAPDWLHGILVLGVYRVLAWVVSVMLPPMAIFFPLFTLLEDLGYLPRIAYNLDRSFKRCKACGKQALTMCMGFGCNAAGVTGCRIIDSPRERLLAILTNNFVPCNGRFPTLIAIITMFFAGFSGGWTALLLTGVILLGVAMTFVITALLSNTLLSGVPSSFTLELPPYRRPQIGKVIVRSIFDRTLFVLGRAAAVAAPAGLIIWLMANITICDVSLLTHCSEFIDPFAQLMGLDGVILMAFILGFSANEIVIPIVIMAYTAQGSITDLQSLSELKELLVANGWTWITAISVMLFSMFHFPCSTTLLTIKKETGSIKWTLISAALPTAVGVAVCILFTTIARLF